MTELKRQEKKDEFVAYYEEVPVIKYAAMYISVTEQTVHNWLNEDESFFSRVEKAKAKWVKKRALKTRAEFQLERLDKEIWQEQKITKVEFNKNPAREVLEAMDLVEKEGGDDGQATDNT